ncbi:MAG: hypothetical protein KIT14_22630 [bacterium]|nr:hypothetical protein [bacterium]
MMVLPPFIPPPWRLTRSGIAVQAGKVLITQDMAAPRAVLAANAHLILAAPFMFGAILGAEEIMAADGWRPEDGLGGEAVIAVQQALAIARGDR